jgi:hypothetical protein
LSTICTRMCQIRSTKEVHTCHAEYTDTPRSRSRLGHALSTHQPSIDHHTASHWIPNFRAVATQPNVHRMSTGKPTLCGWVTDRTLYPFHGRSGFLRTNFRGASERLEAASGGDCFNTVQRDSIRLRYTLCVQLAACACASIVWLAPAVKLVRPFPCGSSIDRSHSAMKRRLRVTPACSAPREISLHCLLCLHRLSSIHPARIPLSEDGGGPEFQEKLSAGENPDKKFLTPGRLPK